MPKDEMVIVVTPLSIYKHNDRDLFAARLEELGLTAYGSDESKAVNRVKNMFNRFVTVYRQNGLLESKLDHVGVEWYWKSEYPHDAQNYEDTNNPAVRANAPVVPKRSKPVVASVQSHYASVPVSQRLAVAA